MLNQQPRTGEERKQCQKQTGLKVADFELRGPDGSYVSCRRTYKSGDLDLGLPGGAPLTSELTFSPPTLASRG
jgi:hypothetical protein